MIVNTVLSAGGNQEPLINHKLNKSGPVKHLFAKAGTKHITGEGVYAFDHYGQNAYNIMLLIGEIEERYND